MKYQLDEVTSVFFHGNEDPIRRLLLILVLMSPLLILYLLVWKDVFSDLKQKKVKLIQTPYLYAALVNLCFIPMFVIHVDWGRHFSAAYGDADICFSVFPCEERPVHGLCIWKNERSCQKKTVVFCYNTGVDGRVCKFWCA